MSTNLGIEQLDRFIAGKPAADIKALRDQKATEIRTIEARVDAQQREFSRAHLAGDFSIQRDQNRIGELRVEVEHLDTILVLRGPAAA